VPIKIWSRLESVESQALDQLKNVASLPWVFHHVAAMADVHKGEGATVGSVVALRGAVSPASVGVDVGCGMAAVRTTLMAQDLPDSLSGLRSAIEEAIPLGHSRHSDPVWTKLPPPVLNQALALVRSFDTLTPEVQDLATNASLQIGTLGGGNHFIELCVDGLNFVWLVLHSGSRNIGKRLADVHVAVAKTLAHNNCPGPLALPDRDLAVFLAGTPEMEAYRHDLYWAQEYARVNRLVMLHVCEEIVRAELGADVDFCAPVMCHHNYVAEETHFGAEVFVTRKGAISARPGEWGIIPGSMGTASYVVRGLGNPDSFCSAPHGAGRIMSRGAARRIFTVADLARQTAGVECRKDAGVIDEIPGAYKDIDEVISNSDDLVEVVARLKQVMCVKG